jgi:hypothetical protein
MSKIALSGNASGTGTFTIASPGTNTDRTLTLPDATGTVNVSGVPNEVPAGSAGAPAIYPTGDTNTGIFFPAADTIAFAEGGVESMRIDSAGRVTMPYQPAFSAKHTATEGPAINAPIIQWGVQVNVGGGAFSNGRYTAPISGKYLISLSLLQNTGTGSGGVYLTQNGATVYRIMYAVTGFGYQMASGTYILSLAANDYIEFINEVGGVQWYGDATGLGAMTVQLIG